MVNSTSKISKDLTKITKILHLDFKITITMLPCHYWFNNY